MAAVAIGKLRGAPLAHPLSEHVFRPRFPLALAMGETEGAEDALPWCWRVRLGFDVHSRSYVQWVIGALHGVIELPSGSSLGRWFRAAR